MIDEVMVRFIQDIRISEGTKILHVFKKGTVQALPRHLYEALAKECPRHMINLTRPRLGIMVEHALKAR